MSQEMNILCCSSCGTYQVHIVKKAKKWQCKICNFKQTIKQVYFKGSGKDCRLYVQKLNFIKDDKVESAAFQECSNMNNSYSEEPEKIQFNNFATANSQSTSCGRSSSLMYLDNDNEIYECSGNAQVDTNDVFFYDNEIEQYSDLDNEAEDNIRSENELDKVSFNDDGNKSESKSTENIFDDNEDFDLTFNF